MDGVGFYTILPRFRIPDPVLHEKTIHSCRCPPVQIPPYRVYSKRPNQPVSKRPPVAVTVPKDPKPETCQNLGKDGSGSKLGFKFLATASHWSQRAGRRLQAAGTWEFTYCGWRSTSVPGSKFEVIRHARMRRCLSWSLDLLREHVPTSNLLSRVYGVLALLTAEE
ncbi:hypothetical protein T310_4087 [Rasamsonia emersonii CBS 393.64]|uniref:Uncharacterized protein n=1 Tax=Rasamsonia emersonii (strain ATCC 16479 / CBS 393.64 / IMI 116815) TaxID=1408163 RepID=A0A0F4YWB9_RASE3|nr:hypothetical protein T310_4087 [Rasamsonia emersonii CBS 393.64]KKA21923.1 hypothetical protein T310_4087 [Rasamsonia emersonii CBS 393.64]